MCVRASPPSSNKVRYHIDKLTFGFRLGGGFVVAEKGCLAGTEYMHTPLPSLAARGDSKSDTLRIRHQLPRGSDTMPGQKVVQGTEVRTTLWKTSRQATMHVVVHNSLICHGFIIDVTSFHPTQSACDNFS